MTAFYIAITDTDSKNHFLLDYYRGKVPAVDPSHTLGSLAVKTNLDMGDHVAASTRYLGSRLTKRGQCFDFLLANIGGTIWIRSVARNQPAGSDMAVTYGPTYLAIDELTPGSIAGVVSSGAEAGVVGATVTVTKGGFSKSATSGALGVFVVTGVPVGTGYALVAAKAGHVSASASGVEVEEDTETEQNLAMIKHGSVVGVTQDQDSTPLGGLTVTLDLADPPIHYETTSDAVTGEFEFPSVIPNVGYTLASSNALYVDASEIINVVEATETEQDLTLSEFGAMAGTVTNADGAIEGATVNVVAEGTTEPILYTADTAADGTFSILNIAPDDYDVWFEATNHVAASISAVTVTAATVTSGTDKVLGKFANISGTITEAGLAPVEGALIALYTTYPGTPAYSAESAADGTWAITNVVPGIYQMRISKTGHIPQFVDDVAELIADADVVNANFTLAAI